MTDATIEQDRALWRAAGQAAAARRWGEPRELVCVQCGQAFVGPARRRYCSGRCRVAAHRAKRNRSEP
jgi:hypothetical protein